MRNNVFRNVTCLQGAAFTVTSNKIIVENELFVDSRDFGFDTYALQDTNMVILNNITTRNVNGTGSFSEYYIYLRMNTGGNVTASNVLFENLNVGQQTGFSIEGSINTLSMTNFTYRNVFVGNGNTLINTGTFNRLYLNGISFSNVQNETPDDENNFMITINRINLNQSRDSLVQNVTVEKSDIGFLLLNSLSGATSLLRLLQIKDIVYRDWYFTSQKDLIKIRGIESEQNFKIELDNLQFSNITFAKKGNMLQFEHQMTNFVEVKNSNFREIKSGVIFIESENKQNLELTTKVRISNVNFTSIDSDYNSLILIQEGGELEIIQSSFSGISWLEEGGVLFAGFQRTSTIIRNSSFTNNTSVQGGLFFVERESVIKVYDSQINLNFAVISGVIQASNNGYFEFHNTTARNNYAVSSSFSQVFDVAGLPVINNSKFEDNAILSASSLTRELTVLCNLLCFLPLKFKQYLIANPSLYQIKASNKLIQLVQGNIKISNKSQFYNSKGILDSYVSSIIISESTFNDLTAEDTILKITSSTVNITDCSFYNIKSTDNTALMGVSFESILYTHDLRFYDSTLPLVEFSSSIGLLTGVDIHNVTAQNAILNIDGATGMTFENSYIRSISSASAESIVFYRSTINRIRNVTISEMSQIPLKIKSSQLITAENLTIEKSKYPLTIEHSNVDLITNSVFKEIGDIALKKGGGMYLFNSNATLSEWDFIKNTAIQGGGLYFSCTEDPRCYLSINDSNFSNNVGVQSGGGFQYDVYRPILQNNIFENNTAVYGKNIASYPIKIKVKETETEQLILNDVGSGITQILSINLALYDHDDQITVLSNSSQIEIKPSQQNTTVVGTTAVKVVAGVATFTELRFTAKPGAQNVPFKVTSEAIKMSVVQKQYGTSYTLKDAIVNFRFCKPGEIEESKTICRPCSPGSYSLRWNSTKCENCIDNANWLGEEKISVDSGFWRYTKNSTFLVECPNPDACLGGYNSTGETPVSWARGYKGLLCSQWEVYEDEKFERLTEFECAKCPDPVENAIKVLGIGILVIGFIVSLIVVNIRKKKESQTSILMRIMTNYLQVISATLAYSMKFPDVLNDMFFPVEQVGSSSQSLLSFDWFARDTQIVLFTPSNPILKAFFTAVLPILLFLGIVTTFGILHLVFPRWFKDFKRNIVVSTITILFLLHPTLTDTALGMFQCIQIDENVSKVRIDLSME